MNYGALVLIDRSRQPFAVDDIEFEAMPVGWFTVHRTVACDGTPLIGLWTLTHAPTSAAIEKRFPRKADAIATAHEIAPLGNWALSDLDAVKASCEPRALLAAILRNHGHGLHE